MTVPLLTLNCSRQSLDQHAIKFETHGHTAHIRLFMMEKENMESYPLYNIYYSYGGRKMNGHIIQ
jgi:hypothetical protein